jgi:hypothetical protein
MALLSLCDTVYAQQHDQAGAGQTDACSAPALSDEERQRQFQKDIKSITIKQMSVFHKGVTRIPLGRSSPV